MSFCNLLAATWFVLMTTAVHAAPQLSCEQAAAEAETAWGVPSGLLLAIGRVESGQWDAARGQTVPWPWSINAAGQGARFDGRQEAVRATAALLQGGARNVDVGCFQVSLQHHPNAFPNLEQAFDPQANALYAARFLSGLRQRLGSWDAAVAAYHSMQPARGLPYQQLVFARWKAPPGWQTSIGLQVASGISVAVFAGVRVWTPSRLGEAMSVISIVPSGAASTGRMPRIIAGMPTIIRQ